MRTQVLRSKGGTANKRRCADDATEMGQAQWLADHNFDALETASPGSISPFVGYHRYDACAACINCPPTVVQQRHSLNQKRV
jgi:hypothetical protein